MKKHFLYTACALIAVGGLIGFTFSPTSGPQHYTPFEPDEDADYSYEDKASSIRGAVEFYHMVRNNQFTGMLRPDDQQRALAGIREMKDAAPARSKTQASDYQWQFLGPDNVGGRTRDMIIDKDDNQLLLVGSVGGGVFRSTNRGRSWQRVQQDFENNAVTCMEQTGNGNMYFGTGELNFNYVGIAKTSGVVGQGVWRSTDRGLSWTKIIGPDNATENDRWANTNELAADPASPSRLYAATDSGLMVSENGDENWQLVFVPDDFGVLCLDIEFSSDGQDAYAVFQNSVGARTCRLYRSQQGGAVGTWERVGEDVISESVTRIEVDVAPSNKNFVYVAAASNYSTQLNPEVLEGFYQSKDAGDSWERLIRSDPFTFYPFSNFGTGNGQGNYDNTCVVDPKNPERVFVGGVHFWRWSEQNGWYRVAGLNQFQSDAPNPFYVHADKHNVIFDTTTSPYRMYVLSDGGIGVSDDAEGNPKPSFSVLNNNYGSIQFYSIAASTQPPYKAFGGAQDNGTQRIEPNSLTGKSAIRVRGGDGIAVEISQYAPQETWFLSNQYGSIYRSFEEGNDASEFVDNNVEPEGSNIDRLGPFHTTFRLWEGVDTVVVDRFVYDDQNPANSRVVKEERVNYRSLFVFDTFRGIFITDGATNSTSSATWYRLSGVFSNGQVIDFAFSKDGNELYAAGRSGGTGQVYRFSGLKDARFQYDRVGQDLIFNPSEAGITTELIHQRPGQIATGVDVDDNNPDRVIVTYGNYDNRDHVYITENARDANPQFRSIQNNLPNFPVYDVQISISNPDEIVLGTEFGLFTSIDGGDNWVESNEGMDRVATFEIKQYMHREYRDDKIFLRGPYFYAGTHGRGVFRTESQNLVLTQQEEEVPFLQEEQAELALYPNPVRNQLNLGINGLRASAEVEVYNMSGQRVLQRQLAADAPLTQLDVSTLDQGTYVLRVAHENQMLEERFIKR